MNTGKTASDIDGNIIWAQPNGKVSAFVAGCVPTKWGWIDYEKQTWYMLSGSFDNERECFLLPWGMIHNAESLGWSTLIFHGEDGHGKRYTFARTVEEVRATIKQGWLWWETPTFRKLVELRP